MKEKEKKKERKSEEQKNEQLTHKLLNDEELLKVYEKFNIKPVKKKSKNVMKINDSS